MTFRLHPLTQVCIALWFSGLAIVSVNPALLLLLLLISISATCKNTTQYSTIH